ncbi:hypothetical protein D6D20_01557 [Aureobasidium pullulans]|uniref:Apple domain-containing protein n=1 Tax=Aureobasidium pullulans TaxID=5580 RepID=A0A4S8ZJA5_AURPU|nr:hypothetical protein D6D20_01557 [Aureobasidium pullulans]
MRLSSFALPALAANLVAALPAPQEIDFDMVLAAPDPTYSEAVGVTAQTITYNSAAMVAEATASISSVSVDASDVLSATAVVQAKRAAASNVCQAQAAGATSAPTYSPDSAAQFAKESYFPSVASASAAAPSGYTQAFVNMQASSSAFSYMGFDTFDTYDVATCATRCTAKRGCVSFNIYFERDPSVNPDDSSCSNPPSVTMIKCSYWGGPVTVQNTVNVGQPRGGFEVAITGSNGYVTTQLNTPSGYQDGVAYGANAMNAPYDAQGYNTFMGSKLFTQGTWDTSLCSQYCESQTTYNLKTAPKDGTPAKVCKFFNTYILTALKADGSVVTQGQYCSLYTEAWPIRYATNGGSWYYGKDQYVVNYSFGFAKTANSSDINPLDGDVKGAVYQAVADIKWSSLQPFCSTYLGYNTATATATSLPYDLAKYPATVISSACSMQATPASSSSTLTSFATSTTATAASTTVV